MIRALIRRGLAREERSLGVSLDYLRDMVDKSLRSFFKFSLFLPLAGHRRVLPASPYFVGRLVAAQDEDCGTCVQIEVNLAKKAGVDDRVLSAVVYQRPEDLPHDLAEVYHFAQAVVMATGEEAQYRDGIRRRYGEEALIELSLGIAAARFFPIVKRALGHATSCALIEIRV